MGGDLPAGTLIDERYQIQDVLGRGGYAVVYRALQVNIERFVALKVLSLGPAVDGDDIERFLRAARLAARIQHPNAVTIYDVGRLGDGAPYIVMEPFIGRNLKRELRHGGPLAPERCIRLFLGCLDALAKAHEAGVIHRDLKPGNLIVTDPGTSSEALKVIDFGIARLRDEQTSMTGSGLLGTPSYLAPEYIREHLVTPALDVYQMGLILVEALTGRQVVRGETPYKCIWQHVSGELDLPPQVMEGELGVVLRRALERDHQRRFPHAAALRDALAQLNPSQIQLGELTFSSPEVTQVSGSNEVSLAPVTPDLLEELREERAAHVATSRRRLLGVVGAAALLLLASTLGVAAWLARQEPPRLVAVQLEAPPEPAPTPAPAPTPEPTPEAPSAPVSLPASLVVEVRERCPGTVEFSCDPEGLDCWWTARLRAAARR